MTKFMGFIILILTSNALASEVMVSVNGMVCSFCAQGIQKKLLSQDSVKSVDVNLGTHLVKIQQKEGQTIKDDTINEILKDSGYTVSKIEREK